MKRILFVCTGNTCRSPMAEGILKKIAKDDEYIIESAGIMALDGESACNDAILSCKEIDIDISNHKSKSISKVKNLEEVDLFIVMSESHADILKKLSVPENKIVVLGGGIPDPYLKGIAEYRRTRDKIKAELINLYGKMRDGLVDN